MGRISTKKRTTKRKAKRSGRVYRRRAGGIPRQPIHKFKRSVYIPNWVNTIPLSDTTFNFNPQLSDVPDHSDFTKLFDQYRISGATFKLIPRFNVVGAEPAGIVPPPPSQVMSVFDYDGQGPTTMNTILQYESLKTTRGMAIHTRFLKPAILSMAYQNTVSTAYAPKWNQFIDTTNDTVPHYGLYGLIPQIGMTYQYDLQATYYIQCKNVR